MPIAADGNTRLNIFQFAFRKKRLKPTKSIAMSSGNKIANASAILTWLANKGSESVPSPAPKPLLEMPTSRTLRMAKMKNVKLWV